MLNISIVVFDEKRTRHGHIPPRAFLFSYKKRVRLSRKKSIIYSGLSYVKLYKMGHFRPKLKYRYTAEAAQCFCCADLFIFFGLIRNKRPAVPFEGICLNLEFI